MQWHALKPRSMVWSSGSHASWLPWRCLCLLTEISHSAASAYPKLQPPDMANEGYAAAAAAAAAVKASLTQAGAKAGQDHMLLAWHGCRHLPCDLYMQAPCCACQAGLWALSQPPHSNGKRLAVCSEVSMERPYRLCTPTEAQAA